MLPLIVDEKINNFKKIADGKIFGRAIWDRMLFM